MNNYPLFFPQSTFHNQKHYKFQSTILRSQLEKLYCIFSLCCPSTNEWMKTFQELKDLYQNLVFQSKRPHKRHDTAQNGAPILKDVEDTYKYLLCLMYSLIYNTFQSLVLFFGSSNINEVMSKFDWSNKQAVIKSLTNEIEFAINKLKVKKMEESLPNIQRNNFESKNKVIIVASSSDDRIERFDLITKYLTGACTKQTPFFANPLFELKLSILPSSPLVESLTIETSSIPFDQDSFKLIVLFCKVQVSWFHVLN